MAFYFSALAPSACFDYLVMLHEALQPEPTGVGAPPMNTARVCGGTV